MATRGCSTRESRSACDSKRRLLTPGYTLEYRMGRPRYDIEIVQVGARADLVHSRVDDAKLDHGRVPLVDDGRQHAVVVRPGDRQAA